jgi:hypothetical protein
LSWTGTAAGYSLTTDHLATDHFFTNSSHVLS